jgi:hypothetical protein
MRRASGSAKSGIAKTHTAEHAAHLLLDFAIHLLDGLVAGGYDHVLQHLDIARHFGVDLDFEQVLLAVHLHGDHAAAGGGFDPDLGDLLLELLLHLLCLAHHLLHLLHVAG